MKFTIIEDAQYDRIYLAPVQAPQLSDEEVDHQVLLLAIRFVTSQYEGKDDAAPEINSVRVTGATFEDPAGILTGLSVRWHDPVDGACSRHLIVMQPELI